MADLDFSFECDSEDDMVLHLCSLGLYTKKESKVKVELPFSPPADDPYFYSDENIKLILSYYNKNKEIDVCIPDMEFDLNIRHWEDYKEHHLQFIRKIEDDLSKLKPSGKFEKFYLFGSRDTNDLEGAVIVQLSHQQDDVKIVVMSIHNSVYHYDFYNLLVDAFKEKSISITHEPACDVCLALKRMPGMQWSQFVQIVWLKIENSSNVHEKIEEILKQPWIDYLDHYQKIVRNDRSENSKANQSMIDEEKVPCGEEQLNCVEEPPIWVRDLEITDPR